MSGKCIWGKKILTKTLEVYTQNCLLKNVAQLHKMFVA